MDTVDTEKLLDATACERITHRELDHHLQNAVDLEDVSLGQVREQDENIIIPIDHAWRGLPEALQQITVLHNNRQTEQDFQRELYRAFYQDWLPRYKNFCNTGGKRSPGRKSRRRLNERRNPR